MCFDRDSQEQIDEKGRFWVGLLALLMFIGVSLPLIVLSLTGQIVPRIGAYVWLGLNLWAALDATGLPWKRTAKRLVGSKAIP